MDEIAAGDRDIVSADCAEGVATGRAVVETPGVEHVIDDVVVGGNVVAKGVIIGDLAGM
jgi:hypothetical protein